LIGERGGGCRIGGGGMGGAGAPQRISALSGAARCARKPLQWNRRGMDWHCCLQSPRVIVLSEPADDPARRGAAPSLPTGSPRCPAMLQLLCPPRRRYLDANVQVEGVAQAAAEPHLQGVRKQRHELLPENMYTCVCDKRKGRRQSEYGKPLSLFVKIVYIIWDGESYISLGLENLTIGDC